MKTKITFIGVVVLALAFGSCSQDFKKTKSGLVYKIIPGGGKDSLAKANNVLKFNFIRKVNDSVLYTSYGKMPGFTQLIQDPSMAYSPLEVLFMMRKGDSAVIVEVFDTLLKKGLAQQYPFAKKGDMLRTYVKILEVYRSDSLAQIDYRAEMEKDRPRQEKEMQEMQAKEAETRKIEAEKELEELRKSGELEKQNKEVEAYIAKKNVNTEKAPKGTYVFVKEKGTGEPALSGKFVNVKYSGRTLRTDSVFQESEYTFQLGTGGVIQGWDDGIPLFNKGGKGTLYIPGYLAYGKNPGPGAGGKPYDALIFDIEVLGVGNTYEEAKGASPAQ